MRRELMFLYTATATHKVEDIMCGYMMRKPEEDLHRV